MVGAVALSSLATVVVMAPVAVVAAASAARAGATRRRRSRRTRRPGLDVVGVLAATVVVPLVALAGPVAALAAVVVFGGGAVALLVVRGTGPGAAGVAGTARRLVAMFAPMVAVTAIVVARHQGSGLAVALVLSTLGFDVGAFVMGNGRGGLGGPVGIAFGAVSVVVVGVFSAAIMNPPFTAGRAGVVFVGVAVLAPLGVWLCQSAVRGERLPAARRFDSLFLSAPFWVATSALLLHR